MLNWLIHVDNKCGPKIWKCKLTGYYSHFMLSWRFTMYPHYHKISNISCIQITKCDVSRGMFLVSFCSFLCPIHWSHVLGWVWRCSWSSAGGRCYNYIWVINNFIAYWGVPYIRGLTVVEIFKHFCCSYTYYSHYTNRGLSDFNRKIQRLLFIKNLLTYNIITSHNSTSKTCAITQ